MGDLRTRRKKAAGLSSVVYQTPGHVVHVIACTYSRRPLLSDPHVARLAADSLTQAAEAWQSVLYCWCIRPDHVHIVLTPGLSQAGDLRRLVGSWKAAVSRRAALPAGREPLWRRGFWDHVLRSDESLRTVCEYVLGNPVRKGFVDRWEDWPHSWLNPEV